MGAIWEFAVVLFLAGGLIAWLGDRLGTYVGKKRLSRFGLRPKHTAMLYTVFSGSLIAVITLLILLAYNNDVRTALLRGREIFQKNRQLAQHIRSLAADATTAELETDVAQRQARDAARSASFAERRKAVIYAQLQDTDQKLRASQAKLMAATRGLVAAQLSLAGARRSLIGAEADLSLAHVSLVERKQEVAEAQGKLRKAQLDIHEAQLLTEGLTEKEQQLKLRNDSLVAQNNDLETKNVGFYNLGNVIYRSGDEIDRTVVDTGQTTAQIRQVLDEWLARMSDVADKHGATTGPNGRAVMVEATVRAQASAPDVAVPEDESLNLLADRIHGQRGIFNSVVVVATACGNALVGEPMRVTLQPFNNIMVFPKDKEIASVIVDGTQPEHVIVASLQAFLESTIRPIAQGANIMPHIDAVTRQPSYGQVDNNWDELVHDIQARGAGAKVRAVTGQDIYTSGPLDLSLELDAVEPAAAPLAVGNGDLRNAVGRSDVVNNGMGARNNSDDADSFVDGAYPSNFSDPAPSGAGTGGDERDGSGSVSSRDSHPSLVIRAPAARK
ncbi:MAG: DUF3084 domain-containing protein [Capsulimonadaceae bacterium]